MGASCRLEGLRGYGFISYRKNWRMRSGGSFLNGMVWPGILLESNWFVPWTVGANIVEGSGRGTYQDNRRFVRIARGSLYEVRHWLRRAFSRGLLSEDNIQTTRLLLQELMPKLNAYLRSIGSQKPMTNDE